MCGVGEEVWSIGTDVGKCVGCGMCVGCRHIVVCGCVCVWGVVWSIIQHAVWAFCYSTMK